MKQLALALLAAAAMLSAGAAIAQTSAPSPPPGDAARGKAAFVTFGCYECHGTMAQGNLTTAPHLAPHPLPWAAVSAYVRKPAGQMPSFDAKVLPDKDLADIYAFLQSIPAAKSPAQIPQLNGDAPTSSK
jgi:cytochrome c553